MTNAAIESSSQRTIHFTCCVCQQVLSKPLRRLVNATLCEDDQQPAIPAGMYADSEDVLEEHGNFWLIQKMEVLTSFEELIDVKPCGDRIGCCGPSGEEPNLTCLKGHMVGTEVADCYQPHFVHLPLAWVDLVEH